MRLKDWFTVDGSYAIVDGQFGSTGKGLLAAFVERETCGHGNVPDTVATNAGPNSGHTFYDSLGNKHVLKQLTWIVTGKQIFQSHSNRPFVRR